MIFISPFLYFSFVYFFLQIAFIAYQNYDSVFGFDFTQVIPLFNSIFKWGLSWVIKYKDNSMTSFEISGDNWSVLFLSGSIPNVKLCKFVVKIDIFDFEINGGDLSFFLCKKISFSESPKKCSLSNITITDKNELVLFFLAIW